MDKLVDLAATDNHPQWFVVAPTALTLVQGPRNYGFLKKFEEGDYLREGGSLIKLAGHWIPKHLVDNIPRDCDARMRRAKAREPRRVLVPVGGRAPARRRNSSRSSRSAWRPSAKAGRSSSCSTPATTRI